MRLGFFVRLFQGVRLSPTCGGVAFNEVESFRDVSAANEYRADEKGWVQISPYGDFPHSKGLQAFHKEDAVKIVTAFNSLRNAGRRIFGLPFYRGHPDADKATYPDDEAYGRIKELEAREDGLYGRTNFSANGERMIREGAYDGHSPYWRFIHDPTRKGVIRPVELISVGLTNFPNIPVKPITAAALNEQENMNEYLKKLALLLALGEAAANEAAIEAKIKELQTAANALPGVKTELATAQTNLSTAQGELTKAKSDLSAANTKVTELEGKLTAANTAKTEADGKVTTLTTERDTAANALKVEREARVKLVSDTAINSGLITQAQRAGVETKLKEAKDDAAFNSIVTELKVNPSKLIVSKSMAIDRTAANGKGGHPGWDVFHADVAKEMAANSNVSYDQAWNTCKNKNEHKALFAEEKE